MDAALIINGIVDTVARDIQSLVGLPVVTGGTWVQAPAGQVFGGFTYSGGKFTAPAAPPPPVVPIITYKADVWRRATNDQAATIDTELTKLDVRMRRLWDDAAYLDHSQPEFLLLQQTMTAAFGAAETARILAPS